MTRPLRIARQTLLLALVLLSTACQLVIPVKAPVPSPLAYQSSASAPGYKLDVSDARAEQARANFSEGVVKTTIRSGKADLEPISFMSDALRSELAARGFPEQGDAAPLPVAIRTFHFENHRVSGFSPWVTLTTIAADVQTPNGTRRLTSFVRRAKLPVWSMDEINDVCFSDALSVATKELVAKMNRALWTRSLSDADVDALVAKIDRMGETDSTWLEVYQLGFSNNPRAIAPLVKLAAHTNEYMRSAAISGLGTLGAIDQLPFLKGLANTSPMWQDRAMALKAIGDLGTTEANAFLDSEWTRLGDKGNEGNWSRSVISLYR